jgi:hypothetical protein
MVLSKAHLLATAHLGYLTEYDVRLSC